MKDKDKLSDWEKRYSWQHKLFRYKLYDAFLDVEEKLNVIYPVLAAIFFMLGLASGMRAYAAVGILSAVLLIIRANRY